jgi:pimeloyl-ACP methyl ester carboxylesterase
MTSVGDVREEIVPVAAGRVNLRVQVAGSGPPLVFLHPAPGLTWDPFLEQLARQYTVYAPLVPGTSIQDPDAIDEVRDLWELVLLEQEGLLALGLGGADIVGASFGGMLACELQATFPPMFGKLVLLDPIGLWRDDAPVTNWLITAPADLPALLFHDPDSNAARAALALPEDRAQRVDAIAASTWALGCTAKFALPIPDRGLARRLHRITTPTLIVWGEDDALVSSVYAQEFGDLIAGSRVEVLPRCGHIPQAECLDQTLDLVRNFLAGG